MTIAERNLLLEVAYLAVAQFTAHLDILSRSPKHQDTYILGTKRKATLEKLIKEVSTNE